jgi:NADH:ubiquinone oxidoreductase subunit 5 (subunit L)/multisubunit Na+/H+ antiporter MnhA subunit
LWVGGCLLVFVAALCALRLLFLLLTAEDGEKPQAFTAPGGAVQTALWSLTILVLSAAALGYPPGAGSFSATDGGLHWDLLFGPGMAGLIGLLVAWLVYGEQSVGAEHKTGALNKFCARGFYAEDLGHNLVGRPLLRFAGWARDLDTFLFELVVIELSALGLRGFGWILGRLQSGQVRFYVAMILLAVLAALCYLTLTWS